MREALRRAVRGSSIELSSEPADVEGALRDPEGNEAYLLNLQEHWFTLRRLDCADGTRRWFNLNSLLRAPEIVSAFFLAAFLAQLKAEGYSIFVVRVTATGGSGGAGSSAAGRLPPPLVSQEVRDAGGSVWHSVDSIVRAGANGGANSSAAARKAAAEKARRAAEEDPEFAAALAASLADGSGGGGGSSRRRGSGVMALDEDDEEGGGGNDEEAQMRKAMAASLADARRFAGGNGGAGAGSSKGARPAHSWGSGQAVGGGAAGGGSSPRPSGAGAGASSSSASVGSPLPPGAEEALAGVDDEDLRAAILLSLRSAAGTAAAAAAAAGAGASGKPLETPQEAIVRLKTSLPPEPAADCTEPVARVVIRLPAGVPPHPSTTTTSSSSSSSSSSARGPTSGQRRFKGSDPLTAVLDFAELCWWEAWVVVGAAGGNTDAAAAAGAGGSSETGVGVGAQEERSPLPARPFSLAMALPPKTLRREDCVIKKGAVPPPTVEGAGLVPSAALNLRPG